MRCPFVAQEFAQGGPMDDLVAGTPPLFVARLVLSRSASSAHEGLCVIVLDMSCALFYANIKRTLCIEFLVEDKEAISHMDEIVGRHAGGGGACGK